MPTQTLSERAFLDELRKIGRRYSVRLSIPRDEIEDCTQDFIVRCLTLPQKPALQEWEESARVRFLRTVAFHHCISYRIRLDRRSRWELVLIEYDAGASHPADTILADLPDRAPRHYPLAVLIRCVFWDVIVKSTTCLSPDLLANFLRHEVMGKPLSEMAGVETGKTYGALRVSIAYTRKRIRFLLQEHGVTESMLRDLLEEAHC